MIKYVAKVALSLDEMMALSDLLQCGLFRAADDWEDGWKWESAKNAYMALSHQLFEIIRVAKGGKIG